MERHFHSFRDRSFFLIVSEANCVYVCVVMVFLFKAGGGWGFLFSFPEEQFFFSTKKKRKKAQNASMDSKFVDLTDAIQFSSVECHNQDTTNNIASIFPQMAGNYAPGAYLQSDSDEQLLLKIPFKNAVKLGAIEVAAPTGDTRRPRRVRIFMNPTTMSFDTVTRLECALQVDIGPWVEGPVPGQQICLIKTPFAKFQNCSCLAIFVENNEGGGDVTVVSGLKFFGIPIGGFDVSAIKKSG